MLYLQLQIIFVILGYLIICSISAARFTVLLLFVVTTTTDESSLLQMPQCKQQGLEPKNCKGNLLFTKSNALPPTSRKT